MRVSDAVRAALRDALATHGDVRTAYLFGLQITGDASRYSAFLALEIVRGERIFTRDPTHTDRFELSVLRRAGDLLPFERQRQALLLDSFR